MVGVAEILEQIDREIAKLQRARALLNGGSAKSSSEQVTTAPKKAKKRNLTPEGRKRIAEAVRRRWERQRKASSGK
jgi:hypothetical protein